jgi:Sec-independent protein translocase protein TatA
MDPVALASIGIILLVFFLWGPQKIPELARMLAQARKEFDNATKEFQKASASIQNGTSPFFAPSSPASAAPAVAAAALPQPSQAPARALPQAAAATPSVKTGDQLLIEAARKLGIPTIGKSREQIQQDIIAMAQRSSAPGNPPQRPDSGDSDAKTG